MTDNPTTISAIAAAVFAGVLILLVVDTWVRTELAPRRRLRQQRRRPRPVPPTGSTAEWATRHTPPPPVDRGQRTYPQWAVDRLRAENTQLRRQVEELAADRDDLDYRLRKAGQRLAAAFAAGRQLEGEVRALRQAARPKLTAGDEFGQLRARQAASTGPEAVDELIAQLCGPVAA